MRPEIWLPVKGFEGYYEVSNNGRIKSVERTICNSCKCCGRKSSRHYREKILLPLVNHKGYLAVELSKDGKGKRIFIHRLVAVAFIPNPENKPQVNHEDGDKTNNFVENLFWSTNKENMQHSVRTGLSKGRIKVNF